MRTTTMSRLAYRCLQRVMVLERVTVMVAETAPTQASASVGGVERLNSKKLSKFQKQGDAPYCEKLIEQLVDPRLSCFGVVEADRLQSFSWFFRGSADADMNYGYCKATATPIELMENTAFVFHSYTADSVRGRGLMRLVLSSAALQLAKADGVEHFVATTEVVNLAARAAFARAGFREVGQYTRFGLGRFAFGVYPAPTSPVRSFG